MVAVYEWSRSHFWNVKGLKARAFARHQYSLLFQQIEVNFTVDITHCASIFCLPDTTWCHCMWQDLPGLHLSKYWRQWRPEKEAKMDSSHTLKVCNLMKGSGFLLLSVDWAPLTLLWVGLSLLLHGLLDVLAYGELVACWSLNICAQYVKKWHYANVMIPLTC